MKRLAHGTLAGVRRTFRAVTGPRRSRRHPRSERRPRSGDPARQGAPVRVLTLTRQEAARLVTRHHAVHKLVLWLLAGRLLGRVDRRNVTVFARAAG